jgi:DNA (cytosine-5)-methyltransferase 1
VLNSKDYGVPHSRERVYIVGFKKELKVKNFEWPKKKKCRHLSKFLQPNKENLFDKNNATFQKYLLNKYNSHKFNLDKILRKNYLILDCRQSDLRIYESVIPTLRAGRHGILYTYNDNLYKLSGYESLLLQGFPSKLAIKTSNVSENKLLLQSGNAMTVTVIYEICKMLLKSINR